MNRFKGVLKNLLWVIKFLGVLFLMMLLVSMISPSFSGNDLIFGRLMTGFVPFLKYNFYEISWNAATWGPGLLAFLIALGLIHRWLSKWAKRNGRPWSFVTSFCLVSVVPVLFVISFIVPGVLLQWEALREVVWIDVR